MIFLVSGSKTLFWGDSVKMHSLCPNKNSGCKSKLCLFDILGIVNLQSMSLEMAGNVEGLFVIIIGLVLLGKCRGVCGPLRR